MAKSHESAGSMVKTIAVIGGGITGLVCARRLSQQGVHVILIEAAESLGGQIRKAKVAGQNMDLGAEAIHISAPGMSALLAEVGLEKELIKSNPGTSWLWTKKGLRRLPAGVGPSGPRRLRPVLRSGVMSIGGLLRAGFEPVIPRRVLSGDIGVGEYVGERFGQEVVERFVDPVLGSLHAGDVNKLSLRAITPELASIADSQRSVMMSRRGQKTGPPLSFATWEGGLSTLIDKLLSDTDVEVRTATTVETVSAVANDRYRVDVVIGPSVEVDGVVLAVPARIAATLVRSLSIEAANLLSKIKYATVATVIVAYSRTEIQANPALKGTGILVPSSRGRLLKAATFVSTKWSHMNNSSNYFIRLSCGRLNENEIEKLDDDELVARLHSDLVDAIGITAQPIDSFVQRWPEAMPQLQVGHLELITDIRNELREFQGVVLAGSSYEGLGIAACVRSGERAAATSVNALTL